MMLLSVKKCWSSKFNNKNLLLTVEKYVYMFDWKDLICDIFSQSLWYISQIRMDILKTTCSIFKSLCHFCTSNKQFLISLKKLQMLCTSMQRLCTILCSFLHYQLLVSCWSKYIIKGLCRIVLPPQHLGISSSLHKPLHAKWLNKLS